MFRSDLYKISAAIFFLANSSCRTPTTERPQDVKNSSYEVADPSEPYEAEGQTSEGSIYVSQRKILGLLNGKELADLISDSAYQKESQGEWLLYSPIRSDAAKKKRYTADMYVHKPSRTTFTAYYTTRDDEDGGNSFGWVQDLTGHLVARIGDGQFTATEPLKAERVLLLSKLGVLPKVLSPSLDMAKKNVVNAYIISLVEEYEGKKTSETADGLGVGIDVETGDPCKKSPRQSQLYICKVDYQNDRWNGSMTATFKASDHQFVSLEDVLFEGSF